MLVKFGNCLQVRRVAVWAGFGCWHLDKLIDTRGFGALPGRVAQGSTTFFALSRGALLGGRSFASFELAAVQGLELGLKLLVFEFYLLGVSALLIQLLVEFFQLIFVVAFGATDLLIPMKDPAGGQSFQIRAPIPVRTAKVVGQVLKFGHGQSGGGSWSSRQLASESRWRSLRTF